MNTWTLQMGYPLITFTKVANSTSWNISQSRFLYTGKVKTEYHEEKIKVKKVL